MGGIYWIASYPKSGNTWFRVFLQNLQSDADSPADINALTTDAIASSRRWIENVAGFELSDLSHEEIDRIRPVIYRWTASQDCIGYHKIHDAFQTDPTGVALVPADATLGVLYLIRNPLDIASSLANHNGTSIDAAIDFMNNPEVALCGTRNRLHRQLRQNLGTWSQHVESWTQAPGMKIHLLRYEDMKSRPHESFSDAALFLQQPAGAERIARAIGFSAFDELSRQEAERGFRERPAVNRTFFRQGKSGAWRERLTMEQVERIIADHGPTMQRYGYLDTNGTPV